MSDASVFRRSETPLSHAVYGLIIALATVGELLNHEASAGHSVGWLLGAGLVLFAAHVFSDLLAQTAAERDDPDWREMLTVGRAELAVLTGFVGAAAIMLFAEIADLDSRNALLVCLALGLIAVAALAYYATAHHRPVVRVSMAVIAAALGLVIVVLENIV